MHARAIEQLVKCLARNRERLERLFHLPGNLGIETRLVRSTGSPATEGLLLWVDGLATPETLPPSASLLLERYLEAGLPGAQEAAPAPVRFEVTSSLEQIADRVLGGWIALVVDNTSEAFLLFGRCDPSNRAGHQTDDREDVFCRDLRSNIALVRERLRSTELLAVPLLLPEQRAGEAALLYREGRASPAVVRSIRRWASTHLGEESVGRGTFNGAPAVFGLLPRFAVTAWADHAAILIDAGYVLLLVDRSETGYIAPVTAALGLTVASDAQLALPLKRWLLRTRTLFAMIVMLLPGAVVSLFNYHQEMIPTAFLLAAGSARESAPFATVFEVLLLEGLTEAAREVSFRLPRSVPVGLTMISYVLIALLSVLVGFVSPASAVAAVLGALVSLALPTSVIAYLVRFWRLIFLLGANTLGFLGMATIFTLLCTYLSQARSWGVPFLGPSGMHLTAPESPSYQAPRLKGGKRNGKAKGAALLR